MTEIPTGVDGRGPKLYLATVIDLYSRRLLGAATSARPDADLACAAIRMAVAARGGKQAIDLRNGSTLPRDHSSSPECLGS